MTSVKTKLADIEKAVEQLSPEDLELFRDWFEELQARLWDQQIERDLKAGKLDWLAEEARVRDLYQPARGKDPG